MSYRTWTSGRHRVLVAWRSSGRLWEKQGVSLSGFTHKDSLEILGRDTKGDSILSRFEPGYIEIAGAQEWRQVGVSCGGLVTSITRTGLWEQYLLSPAKIKPYIEKQCLWMLYNFPIRSNPSPGLKSFLILSFDYDAGAQLASSTTSGVRW